jgi:hypothetical protein
MFFEHSSDLLFRGVKGEVSNIELDVFLSSRVEAAAAATTAWSSTGTAFALRSGFIHSDCALKRKGR